MISQKLRTIIEAMQTAEVVGTAMYQTPSRANVDLSDAVEPMAVYFCTTEGQLDIVSQVVRERARVQIAFVKRAADMSVDGATNDNILLSIRPIVADFVARLRADRTLTEPDAIDYRVLYNYDDTNTTGYLLDFRVAERVGECIAVTETEPDEDNEDNQD